MNRREGNRREWKGRGGRGGNGRGEIDKIVSRTWRGEGPVVLLYADCLAGPSIIKLASH